MKSSTASNYLHSIHLYITYLRSILRVKSIKSVLDFLHSIKILNSESTINLIIENNLSVSRFGDGEFDVMTGGANGFQQRNSALAIRLKEVLTNPLDGNILCVPYTLKDLSTYRIQSRIFAIEYLYKNSEKWLMPFLSTAYTYGDCNFTRFYMMRKDKSHCKQYVELLKKLWHDKNLLIVEGENSLLGVGNDLFANSKSIRRIICPSHDAFEKYDEILNLIKIKYEGRLVILALGMTATVLAYDLCKDGIRALDLGHIDVEYEWMLMGATEKCPIPGKHVNEVAGTYVTPTNIDLSEYHSQIVGKIL